MQSVHDNTPSSMNSYSALGKTVIAPHRRNEVSVIEGLKQNSVRVEVGCKVKKGHVLGICGNADNVLEPHIRYYFQSTQIAPIFNTGQGLVFSSVRDKDWFFLQ